MDWNKAYALLHICDKARQWPHLQWLHDHAMGELGKMQGERDGPRLEAQPSLPLRRPPPGTGTPQGGFE